MPPRKRPTNVVRSGNAGNSTKASPLPVAAPPGPNDPPPRPPPLFPLGYKTPIALLTEKCQKMGWEKPVIDSVRRHSDDCFANGRDLILGLTQRHSQPWSHSRKGQVRMFMTLTVSVLYLFHRSRCQLLKKLNTGVHAMLCFVYVPAKHRAL